MLQCLPAHRSLIIRAHVLQPHSHPPMAVDADLLSSRARLQSRADRYYWRLVATGLSFLVFGLGAFVYGVVVLPLARLIPGSRTQRRDRARRIVSSGMRLFVAQMRAFGLLTCELRGVERLGQSGQLIIANHPSLIDVVFLLAFAPGAVCVVKHGLWRNPLTRTAVRLAEYIPNAPTASMIEEAAAALSAGQTVIMFPEGTRTTPLQAPVFHRGAANVAVRAARLLTPVYIRCEPTTLTKAERWFRIPGRRPRFTLRVGADVAVDEFRSRPLPLASRTLNERLQAQFQAEIGKEAAGR